MTQARLNWITVQWCVGVGLFLGAIIIASVVPDQTTNVTYADHIEPRRRWHQMAYLDVRYGTTTTTLEG
jgi:hypothetical protein